MRTQPISASRWVKSEGFDPIQSGTQNLLLKSFASWATYMAVSAFIVMSAFFMMSNSPAPAQEQEPAAASSNKKIQCSKNGLYFDEANTSTLQNNPRTTFVYQRFTISNVSKSQTDVLVLVDFKRILDSEGLMRLPSGTDYCLEIRNLMPGEDRTLLIPIISNDTREDSETLYQDVVEFGESLTGMTVIAVRQTSNASRSTTSPFVIFDGGSEILNSLGEAVGCETVKESIDGIDYFRIDIPRSMLTSGSPAPPAAVQITALNNPNPTMPFWVIGPGITSVRSSPTFVSFLFPVTRETKNTKEFQVRSMRSVEYYFTTTRRVDKSDLDALLTREKWTAFF